MQERSKVILLASIPSARLSKVSNSRQMLCLSARLFFGCDPYGRI